MSVGSQNAEGGWRYLPGATDSDLSVTACQLVALRAARVAGIDVPDDTLRRGLGYVKRSYVDLPPARGAFYYQLVSTPPMRSRYSFALTAGGLAVLAEAGESSSKEARAAFEYLRSGTPPSDWAERRFDYYYAHHFAISAFRFATQESLAAWHRSVAQEFLEARGGRRVVDRSRLDRPTPPRWRRSSSRSRARPRNRREAGPSWSKAA